MDGFVEADFLIASGCLTPIESFDAIGLLNDDMFIDYVDIEWGCAHANKAIIVSVPSMLKWNIVLETNGRSFTTDISLFTAL